MCVKIAFFSSVSFDTELFSVWKSLSEGVNGSL